jgi:hypothetical protein
MSAAANVISNAVQIRSGMSMFNDTVRVRTARRSVDRIACSIFLFDP